MDHIPIVCTLTPSERAQGDRLPALLRRAPEAGRAVDRLSIRFDGEPGVLALIADAVERERQCCRFFRFQIALEPGMGSITRDVSGHADAKAFLASLA